MKVMTTKNTRMVIDDECGVSFIVEMVDMLRSGSITINSNGKIWSTKWSPIDAPMAELLLAKDDHAVICDLSDLSQTIVDLDGAIVMAKKAVLAKRHQRRLGSTAARTLIGKLDESQKAGMIIPDAMQAALGGGWYLSMPVRENPEYSKLLHIISLTKQALVRSTRIQALPVLTQEVEKVKPEQPAPTPAPAPASASTPVVPNVETPAAMSEEMSPDMPPAPQEDLPRKRESARSSPVNNSGLVVMDVPVTRINWLAVFFWMMALASSSLTSVFIDNEQILAACIVTTVLFMLLALRLPLRTKKFNRMVVTGS